MSAPKSPSDSSTNYTSTFSDFNIRDIPEYVSNYMRGLLDLHKGVNEHSSIVEIRKKSSMAGANAWMLMCSIVIASIGLSQNSQAVIIGAMLISPLMSPILGIGLSIGINDMDTLHNSLTHFGIAILIALLTSTLYFDFTPFDGITEEIESRTRPTFLDVLVAVFGGVAGIISIVRKDVSTTLPGVAIATALMPPLCVAGYGISHGMWEMASKAFYLFFLNSFFVALSTYVIIRLLRFPYKKYMNPRMRRINMLWILLASLAMIIPSYLIFRSVLEELRLESSMRNFSVACLGDDSIFLDNYELKTLGDGSKLLYLKVYGDQINERKIEEYKSCLKTLSVENCEIEILNSSVVDISDVELLNKGMDDIRQQLAAVKEERLNNRQLIDYYASNQIDTLVFNELSTEIKTLYPTIERVSAARMHNTDFTTHQYYIPTFLLEWKNPRDPSIVESTITISSFLEKRLNQDSVRVVSLP